MLNVSLDMTNYPELGVIRVTWCLYTFRGAPSYLGSRYSCRVYIKSGVPINRSARACM